MEIRMYKDEDAKDIAELIHLTLKITNSKDYSEAFIRREIQAITPTYIRNRASWTHFYVVCDGEKIIGCGAIGPYYGKCDESSLFTIFVHPTYQGKGIGRKIIETLEQDEYFLRAKRIEIPASITGCEFYRKMGYDYKNGIDKIDDEELYRLEKFRGRK